MFLNNRYTTWYYKIINDAKDKSNRSYTETHHILPKSLGGSNDLDNKVKLTAREHFVVHKLLVKMTKGKDKSKMSFAYNCFFLKNKQHIGRLSLFFTSREYERRKKLVSKALSKLHKGKTVSKETVEKIQRTRKLNNKPYPEKSREQQRKNTKKRWEDNYEKMAYRSQLSRDKISKSNKGIKRSEEAILQNSIRNRGSGNGNAKKITVTSPEGIIYYCHGDFQSFCKEHNLPFSSMCHILHKTRHFKSGATIGWKASFLAP
jgi:predicted nucleic acid binding AN1-type Zn finger protein